MTPQIIEERVDRLERRVTNLERLPARIDALTLQVSQLRVEMRGEFSAVRREMRSMGDELRSEMHGLHGTAMHKIEELNVQMRVLHEEVISRLALLAEGAAGARPRKPRR